MAGTLFGLPLSQQLDENGNPQSGALLYVYAALTSTPVDTFADSGLATLNSFPLVCDASGRIPQFWVDDGSYRARLTTAAGVEIFDEDSILALGPSVASTGGGSGGGGGGGSGTTDSTTIFGTGDMKWYPVAGTVTGWVRCNGRTIGSAGSGATERASSDTETLYGFLWNNFNNTLCPVATGRGAGPTADFAANKAIGTLDMRGYGIYGLDDMGNSAASRLVTGTPTAAASSTGAEKTTLAEANLPAHTHGAGTFAVGTALTNATAQLRATSTNNATLSGGGFDVRYGGNEVTVSLTSGTVSGTSGSTGSGTAATTISPGRLGTWLMKL